MVRNLLVLLWVVFLGVVVAFASCSAPQNAIEAENCNPGAPLSQWNISGSGDSTIQGFATDISVNVSQTVYFKIDTTAANYRIDIFRMGYYQGNGARFITSFQPSATLPQVQPPCISDSSTNLVDCGNWAVSASWTVPPTATSGIYFALLTRTDTGGVSYIHFIVRNDASHSDIVFQTSDETWHAYNEYGGHSLYGPTNTFDITNRAYKVSYNRPFHTRSFENASFVFYAEYPMVRWLEANGYDVTYSTSVDTARYGNLILNHKVFLSVGHDEYWSAPKRASVETARNSGVNLAFFSGNEVFWKTRWENSIDGSGTPYRTLVCYKETIAEALLDPLDPPTWTGTWRDPTFSPPADGGRPENILTGTLFMVNGPGTDNNGLAIKVPAADGKMRFWRNTALASQTAGQVWTLPSATLGYEWDVDADNGHRPAGLFDLSTATYTLTTDYLLDYGATYGAGTATHHLTLYRASSGALVFGAGTVQWSWGLDANHDVYSVNGSPADPNMQQATVNLFADMGVQPVTLQAGLLLATQSVDNAPPASTITFPTNGGTVPTSAPITITGIAADSGGGVIGGVEVSFDGGTTWHPATGRERWSYTWTASGPGNYTVQSRATDDSGNIEYSGPTVSFNAENNAQSLASITLTPTVIVGGGNVQGTITLGQPAASGGVVVTLSSSSPAVATVPSSVMVPAGAFTFNFTVSTSSVLSSTPITITGVFVTTKTAALTVKPQLPPPPGTLAVDAVVSNDQGTAATSVTSSAVSTAIGDELLLAFVATDGLSPNVTVTGVSGAGLAWNLVVRTNTQLGTAEVWRAFTPVALNNASVTATLSQKVASSITIMTFAGVDTSGTNGSGAVGATASANAASGAPNASLTTTRNNSLVLGVGSDWDTATPRTLPSNQTMVHQYLSPTGDTYWVQQQSAPTPASGTLVKINDTAPTGDRYNLSAVEVLPATSPTYFVSGSISPGPLGSGATVTLTQGASTIATVTADSSGNFTFSSVPNGTYTITPTKSLVSFTPVSQSVTVNAGSVTGVTFTATSQSWSISGTISPPTAGITVNLAGTSSGSTTTDGSGNYSFSGLANGNYTVTPSKAGYTFSPASQSVTVNGANVPSVNFTATQTWSISGTITPATAGITVSLSGTSSGSTTTDGSGNYSFSGLANGSYTVTPSKAGYTFSPASQSVTVNGANVPSVNFTATLQTWAISGTIAPATAGITVNLAGTSSGSTTTDGSGNYSFSGLANGNYTVTPSKAGYTFSPTAQSVTVNGANVPGVNFTARQTWSISGTFSPPTAGITVNLTGTASGTTTTDGSGNYSFSGLANGNYTVTPSKAGYTFSPTSQSVTVNGANVPGVNFVATVQTWAISGTISPATAGITVNLIGTASGSTSTDVSGNFSFTGLVNGTYTLTPSHTGYIFTPSSQAVTVNSANVMGQNFTWTTASSGIAIDANVSKDNASSSTTLATPAFSTTAGNELLLAFVATDYLTGSNTKVNSIAGGGLTWTLVKRTNTQSGSAEIWRAFATAPLSNVTVTATLSQKVVASIALLSYTGVDTTGSGSGAVGATGSGTASSGAPAASLVTTRNNSWVFGVGNDFDNAIARTPGSGQTLVHQYLTTTGDTYWVQMQNASTPLSGTSVTINDTAPAGDRYNLTTVEVRTP